MGLFHHESEEAQAYDTVININDDDSESPHHKARLSHEVIAAAASYEAAKAYQQHLEKNGQPSSHAQAKEILAGFAGAAVDYIIETKGLDFVDRERAKRDAHKKLAEASADDYETE